MNCRALILLHPDFEEMEAAAPIDLLSRAGVEIVQASTDHTLKITGRSKITWRADQRLAELADEEFDAIILPGGPGISQLRRREDIVACLRQQISRDQLLACICAAPLLLLDADLLSGRSYTAHPTTYKELTEADPNSAVVVDLPLITSRGAGTATEFALSIVAALCGREKAVKIAEAICFPVSKTLPWST